MLAPSSSATSDQQSLGDLSFRLGGVLFEPEIDTSQFYKRSDLSAPFLFAPWDLPIFVKVDHRRLMLVFRRYPDLRWRLAKEGSWQELILSFQRKILVSFNLKGTTDKLVSSLCEIISQRISLDLPESMYRDLDVLNVFASNLEGFDTQSRLGDDEFFLDHMRHRDKGLNFVVGYCTLGSSLAPTFIDAVQDDFSFSERHVFDLNRTQEVATRLSKSIGEA